MLIFMVKYNFKIQISWKPGWSTRVNAHPPEKIHGSHVERAYKDRFGVPTVSRSPSSAHTYLPRPLHGPECVTVSTFCTYTDISIQVYFGVKRSCCLSVFLYTTWAIHDLLPLTKLMSMQKVKVIGRSSRTQRSKKFCPFFSGQLQLKFKDGYWSMRNFPRA